MKSNINFKLRYNLITVFIYVIGIILLLQLFNLQIIHGAEYREQSNNRLTRESTLEAARGSILDNSGNELAGTSMGFSLELYKTKIDSSTLNSTILKIVNVLEINGDKYVDSFPININPFEFNFSTDEKLAKWKKDNKFDENITAEEAFYKFKEKYKIENDNIEEVRKIIAIRYEITQKGYSSIKAITLCSNLSRQSVLVFNERSSEFLGVNVVVEPVRNYTSGTLAAHIIGNIGKIDENELATRKDTYDADDIIGKNGIEYACEEYLKGEDGVKQIDMSVDGTVNEEYITKEAVKGSDVVLTIDANLQKATEEALVATIDKIRNGGFSGRYDANAGAAVVMNVKTGEILAMASYPTYNPQDFVGGISNEKWAEYRDNTYKPLRNKAIQDAYAPGSIFKMVTAIAGLESGVVTTKEKIYDTGIYPKYTNPKCWYYTDYHRGHGNLNVSEAIQKSCNFFFYTIGDRMGIDTLEKYARYFGLGNKTGIELPNETSGFVASRNTASGEPWYGGQITSASIGQGDNQYSPLQIAKYISMLTNGGNVVEPTIIKSIIKSDGTEVPRSEYKQKIDEKLGIKNTETESLEIHQENLDAVLNGMKSVAMDGGTAYNIFRTFEIEIGGKTGSAEAGRNVNAWFAGFAPFDDPEIAVVVFIENGGHGNYSGEAVRNIMNQYFGMNITQVQENMTALPYTELFR